MFAILKIILVSINITETFSILTIPSLQNFNVNIESLQDQLLKIEYLGI